MPQVRIVAALVSSAMAMLMLSFGAPQASARPQVEPDQHASRDLRSPDARDASVQPLSTSGPMPTPTGPVTTPVAVAPSAPIDDDGFPLAVVLAGAGLVGAGGVAASRLRLRTVRRGA